MATSEEDLARIERCLPEVAEDGAADFAVGPLGTSGEDGFDTDDVRSLVNEVRRLQTFEAAMREAFDECPIHTYEGRTMQAPDAPPSHPRPCPTACPWVAR